MYSQVIEFNPSLNLKSLINHFQQTTAWRAHPSLWSHSCHGDCSKSPEIKSCGSTLRDLNKLKLFSFTAKWANHDCRQETWGKTTEWFLFFQNISYQMFFLDGYKTQLFQNTWVGSEIWLMAVSKMLFYQQVPLHTEAVKCTLCGCSMCCSFCYSH